MKKNSTVEVKSKLNENPESILIKNAVSSMQTSNVTLNELDTHKMFSSIDEQNRGFITSRQMWDSLGRVGIKEDDPRLNRVHELINSIPERIESDKKITFETFNKMALQNVLIRNALIGNLSIPDFKSLCHDLEEIFYETKKIKSGKVADYIPQLARVNPEHYAISICTIDGQRFSLGDAKTNFCLQSTSKPINYCIVHEDLGEDKVHKHIGREPSGLVFNELSLNSRGLPHNPLINAGAIMCCSLIKRELEISDRFEHVTNVWKELTGGTKPNFNNSVYLSERQTADRNFALAYFMRENGAFPPQTNLVETLEFYFQCCSMELNADAMAVAAASLANAGICPITDKKVFNPKTIQNCLSLMYSCGMYDFSGEFSFKIGLPAKSGVSGALMVVIPQVMGICIWSPRLDEHGNSVRGVEFCRKLVEHYNFHNYDILVNESSKKDPRGKKYESKVNDLVSLIWAATYGDLDEIQRLEARGMDLNVSDYDGRTAIHLSAAEGNLEVIKYLIEKKVNINPRDRWNGTPLTDAKKCNHIDVIDYLILHGGIE